MYTVNPKTMTLISTPRLNAFQQGLLRQPTTYTQQELIGSYIWNQQMAACLYPLLQNMEVFLRNAIDNAARAKYGDYWWDIIDCQRKNNFFFTNIQKAKDTLDKEWRKKHGKHKTPPTWSHDKIIAATEFSTWIYLFDNDFIQPAKVTGNYLFPSLLGHIFHQWHKTLGHSKPHQAIRVDIRNLLEELRIYRNRISHYEPTWLKAYPTMNPTLSLSTIEDKIRKIEKIYQLIHPDIHKYMLNNGLIEAALNHCKLDVLEIYQGIKTDWLKLSRTQQKSLNIRAVYTNQQSSMYFQYKSCVFVLQKFKNRL